MAHGYRNLQHWNHWLSQQFLGQKLLESESQLFANLLQRHFGKQVILIGVPNQYELLNSAELPCHSLLTPLICHDAKRRWIEGDLHELPIMTGSVDLVMLPHTLEYVDNPRRLLSEACRIIKPEGLIILSGFNPYSAWGLKQFRTHNKKQHSWRGNLIPVQRIKKWLKISDFVLEKTESTLFTPPINHAGVFNKLHFLERIGPVCFPMVGGVYTVLARAKVMPLTPIRLKWKQQLSGIRISTSISGHIARQSRISR